MVPVAPAFYGSAAEFPQADMAFGLALFGQLAGEDTTSNVVLSPPGIVTLLTLIANGAHGETREAILRTLLTDSGNLERLNRQDRLLQEHFDRPRKNVTLAVASSLWLREDFRFARGFREIAEFFDCQIQSANFSSPKTSQLIDDWAQQQTHGLLNPQGKRTIDADTALYLVNATYFKGAWTTPFDPRMTQPGSFTKADGEKIRTPMMREVINARMHADHSDFQILRLPYGDGRLAMYVFLPRRARSIEDFHRQVNVERCREWIDALQTADERPTLVSFPRFTLKTQVDLSSSLKEMSLGIAFDEGRADFSSITTSARGLFLQAVEQSTFISVTEEGTEAAARTDVKMGLESAIPSFIVDRPFVFAIRDDDSGSLLFIAQVAELD